MITDKRSANAVGGKTARACDSCLRRRARWYCTADEAFLCQACDTSVHSANQLASRHERVRLEASSSKQQQSGSVINQISAPSWHQGFTRKARTPRNSNNKPNSSLLVQQTKGEDGKISNPDLPFVPEIEGEDASPPSDEHDDRISYRVPVFDRFDDTEMENEMKILLMEEGQGGMDEFENFPGFLPSDLELAEFAADVESLLGGEFEENTSKGNGLGRLSCEEKGGGGNGRVKVEEEEEDIEAVLACQWDYPMAREAFEWDFDPTVEVEEEEKVVAVLDAVKMGGESKVEMNRNIVLKLNYEGVITAWANQGSPWTTGIRPEFNLDDCWPDFMDVCPTNIHSKHGDTGRRVGGGENNDGAREARVSRYREKRRTRLFSKKIRYEVRKLNAEKRPRMKGRFVKRTSFTGPTFPNYLIK